MRESDDEGAGIGGEPATCEMCQRLIAWETVYVVVMVVLLAALIGVSAGSWAALTEQKVEISRLTELCETQTTVILRHWEIKREEEKALEVLILREMVLKESLATEIATRKRLEDLCDAMLANHVRERQLRWNLGGGK